MMASPSPRRRYVGTLLTLLIAALLVGGTAGSAQAADGYRYWNYFHVKNGEFAFATTGAAGFTPTDGGTEAYRYGTSATQQGLKPRADLSALSFDKVCAGAKAQAGKKRVAVLLDYGTKADAQGATVPAPRAACAVVPSAANGQQVLDAVASVRTSKGMICGVDGYPASGCGVPVKDASAPAAEATVDFALPGAKDASSQGGNSTPLLLGGAFILVLLVGGGIALTRRTRSA